MRQGSQPPKARYTRSESPFGLKSELKRYMYQYPRILGHFSPRSARRSHKRAVGESAADAQLT